MRVNLTAVFEGECAGVAGAANIANVNQRATCHANLAAWVQRELEDNKPWIHKGVIQWSEDPARRKREKAWIAAGPEKTLPNTLWSIDGSAEAASMQGCTVSFWDPIAFVNADLAGTKVQCPKCHGKQVSARPNTRPTSLNAIAG